MTDSITPADSLTWRKASASTPNGQCVEVAIEPVLGFVMVRDSKNPDGPVLEFTPLEWLSFMNGVRAGEFDLAAPSPAEFVETLRPQFKTLAQLTAEQGVRPIADLGQFAAAPEDRLSDEEFDSWRSAWMRADAEQDAARPDDGESCRCPGNCEGGPECLDDEGGPLPSRAQIEAHAHTAWSDVRAGRMDSPEAQAGHQAAADEHNRKEPS